MVGAPAMVKPACMNKREADCPFALYRVSIFNVYTSLALNHVVCRPVVLEVCNIEGTTATLSTWPNPEAYYWQFL